MHDFFQPENEQEDDQERQAMESSLKRRRILIRLFALLTVISFLFLMYGGFFRYFRMPPLSVLAESVRISRDPNVREWRKAVYSIYADGRIGTGFLVYPSGFLVTNHHIIEQASRIRVSPLPRGIMISNQWQSFPESDLTLIRLLPHNRISLPLETGSEAIPGEKVVIIGNPLGFFRIATQGTVEGYATVGGWDFPLLLVRGSIYEGNSGSPVINQAGRVVGILFAVVSMNGENTVGLAIPAEVLSAYLP